ncbi:MAG: hypothetical protein GY938_06280 [Ketobacter sp.]|nr:hypothetical protein [Ketobacter sp.]
MQGSIQQARESKSGKTLSVQIDGQWYTTKDFELQNMVGQTITFTASVQEFPDGGSCTWLNNYQAAGQSTTPAAQAFDAAHAQAPPMGQPMPPSMGQPTHMGTPPDAPVGNLSKPQKPQIDRDASIVAQALTKAVTCANAQQAWESYVYLYNKVLEWNPGDFDDSIPM